MNTLDLQGRRAVITGGARGMGFAFAKRFLESGASVALWDVNEVALQRAKTALDPLGKVITDRVDVSDYANVETAATQAAEALGGIDILVNAAGIAGVNTALVDYPIDTWNAVMNVNLNGIFHTCRAIVPHMQTGDYGRIVNISSMAGKEGNPNASAYSVSKAGVIGLTKSLGKELATSNIRVNAICPAVIKTEMLDDVTEEQIGYMLAKIPMGRMGTVEEISAMVGWMCSQECSYSTGAVFDLSGGRATY
ncbi:SDR family NAD(P)-dependent oxidoreductase [Marinovum sp. 2_MG-2023]|uniref:SDR family NAD(P)-dependent oxidoreductase n=1 Tax=unclassified Marinovum TaxID=2647166 RepID=UPI0026E4086D|nr:MULTISPECIES: SDR family NAD(P)-dependent oxidoreductase [unclassified Marinovum]MDO6730761.1 SDR family NAD(P)-dependent oxidoreductase [Marinovum sp. 2_MG-2023]MDO6780034.1 SDR family NAD(P)-dependent oxidoreductase [Marinovum sp. 1_MG-2023]